MNLYGTLSHMYPDLKLDENYVIRQDEETGEETIIEWKAEGIEQPSKTSLIDHWERFKDEIAEMFRPQPSEVEILEQTQADLIYTLMVNGVI